KISEESISSQVNPLALGRCLSAQLVPDLAHLFPRVLERAAVVDHVIGDFCFLGFGQLRRHAALDLFASGVEVNLMTSREASDPLLVAAGDHDQPVEA